MGLVRSSGALRVLAYFLERPAEARYGLEITKAADVRASTLYPLLARLEDAGWFTSEWEDADPVAEGRPKRRLYRLTDIGAREARRELQPLYERLRAIRPAFGSPL